MKMDEKIKRINELYHLSQERALSDDEKAEQAELRKQYIASVKANLKTQLDNIEIEDEKGNVYDLKTYNKSIKK